MSLPPAEDVLLALEAERDARAVALARVHSLELEVKVLEQRRASVADWARAVAAALDAMQRNRDDAVEAARLACDERDAARVACEQAREERDAARFEAGALAEKWGKSVKERDALRARLAELEAKGGT